MSEVIVGDNNFEAEVLNSPIPVLVDFWAEWCGPCKMLAPTIEELAKEFEGRVKVCKVDVDDAPEAAQKFAVQSIPTLMVFHKGDLVKQSVGVLPKDKIEELFSDLI